MAPDDAILELPSAPRAARLARDFVRRSWPEVATDMLDNVALCVSELVTNALDHARPPYSLRLDRSRDRLRIEVLDSSDGKPELRSVSPSTARGRGMFIVSRIATTWGVDKRGRGKSVWAEFQRD
jgi:anti-sigma regulatory factor (Ser/Thr protein kinase)